MSRARELTQAMADCLGVPLDFKLPVNSLSSAKLDTGYYLDCIKSDSGFFWEFLAGVQPLILKPTIVDSFITTNRDMAGVLMHVSGSMFVFVLADLQLGKRSLYLIDGAILNWSVQPRPLLFLDSGWDRSYIYSMIVDGIQASYYKQSAGETWNLSEIGNKKILAYLKSKGIEA